MRTILVLGAILILWKLFGKRLLGLFFLRGASRAALSKIGDHAVSVQSNTVRLVPLEVAQWKDPATPRMMSDLAKIGYIDIGAFSVDPMPGVKVDLMVNTSESVAVHIFEHSKGGAWVEFVTRYQDETNATLTTLASTGLSQPSWLTTMRAAKGPAAELSRQFVAGRPMKAMKSVTPNEAQAFEEDYARYMSWRKETKMKPEEVAPTVKKWAETKQSELAAK